MSNRQQAAEASLQDQENILPKKKLIVTFSVLAISYFTCFLDQNGIGQLLPTVARDLDATNTISWAAASALIGNTTFQVLYGRLSDIFGRKVVYLSALGLLCFSDFMCGASKTAPMLYLFRGLTGVAGGGITSLSMIIVSDIVTLDQRGKYQGILSSMVGLGNLVGPLVAAEFAEIHYWRGLYWVVGPIAGLCGSVAWWFLPATPPMGPFKEQAKKIDYWGVITASIGVIFLLIPISGGGSYFQWRSAMVVSMLVIGGIFCGLFIYVELKVARLPILPLSMFTNRPVAALLLQNFFFGMVLYTHIYALPLYFQNVREFSPIKSAMMVIPLVSTQSIASILSGQYISHKKRYGEVIWLGFFLFTLGTCLTTLFDRTFPIYGIVLILIVLGIGNGNVFQPTIVALQAHCSKSQRAVVISARNFLRCLGGSVSLAVSAAIQQNVLKRQLPAKYNHLAAKTYARPDFSDYSPEDDALVSEAYAKASRAVFVFMTPCAGLCLLAMFLVKDRGLTRPEEVVKSEGVHRDEEDRNSPSVHEKRVLKQKQGSAHTSVENSAKTSAETSDCETRRGNGKCGQLDGLSKKGCS
ncbi:mfs transporter [Venturia nashicola]|uniref:Mfs transporter n=1 Tax=Venturia nashicola TaxID=86259 RepID=A0A4Z1NRD4_9PEZI|nr:mfs transporter [Venturia nashicola]